MRRSNEVFSTTERRGALWVVVGCIVVASVGAAADKFVSPSLGWYGHTSTAVMDGVLEAQPLG